MSAPSLQERLLALASRTVGATAIHGEAHEEAATRLDALERENEGLRKALRDLVEYEHDVIDLHAPGRFARARAALAAKEARIADLERALVGVLDLAENEAELRRRNVTGRNMTGAKKLETIKLLARSALTPTPKARETEGEVRK